MTRPAHRLDAPTDWLTEAGTTRVEDEPPKHRGITADEWLRVRAERTAQVIVTAPFEPRSSRSHVSAERVSS